MSQTWTRKWPSDLLHWVSVASSAIHSSDAIQLILQLPSELQQETGFFNKRKALLPPLTLYFLLTIELFLQVQLWLHPAFIYQCSQHGWGIATAVPIPVVDSDMIFFVSCGSASVSEALCTFLFFFLGERTKCTKTELQRAKCISAFVPCNFHENEQRLTTGKKKLKFASVCLSRKTSSEAKCEWVFLKSACKASGRIHKVIFFFLKSLPARHGSNKIIFKEKAYYPKEHIFI